MTQDKEMEIRKLLELHTKGYYRYYILYKRDNFRPWLHTANTLLLEIERLERVLEEYYASQETQPI